MYEIFNQDFIATCRSEIDAYNGNRGGFSKFFASGAFRKLPQLDALLENASTAQHCAYILVYIYNEMSSHNTEKFYDLAKKVRSSIYDEMEKNPEILQSFQNVVQAFKSVLNAQTGANEQHCADYGSTSDNNTEYKGPSLEEMRARTDCIQAFIDALDVPTHKAMTGHTTVRANLEQTYSENVNVPTDCIINPAPELTMPAASRYSGCVVS